MRNGILIVCNNEDVSDFLERNSLDKNEALNNNKNTCGFTLLNKRLTEQDEVVIYDYIQNIVPITSGQNFMYVNDTYQFEEKYTVGSTIFVDILGKNLKMTISEVDTDTKKIIFTTNFTSDYPVKAYHGTKFFGGTIDRIEEKKLSKSSNDIRYDYSLLAYEKMMDRKVVIDTFIEQYIREIIGRIVYKFMAVDNSLDVFSFETPMTGSGLCTDTTNFTDQKISGNNSQKGICTGNGSRSKTISSIDISGYELLKFWRKIKEGQGSTITKLSLRIGSDSSNYFEYNIDHVGNDREDCWLFENLELLYPTTTIGSPTLTNISWLSFAIESTGTNYVLFDTMFVSNGGISMGPCKRGTRKLDDVRFKGIQPSTIIETLTKNFEHYRYVDYNKAIHYYYQDGEGNSTFQITPTERKYNSLQVKVDTTQIINRQLVEGSEAPAEAIYPQERKADGVQKSFSLDFKAAGERQYPDGSVKQGLKVFVNNVEKTVGLEGMVDETAYDFVYSFNEKVVRNANLPILSVGDVIKFTYYPYKTISVRYQDMDSINLMKALVGGDGIFDGKIIIDKTIESIQIARQRAVVEVQSKKDPIITYEFTTDIAGIQIGQMVYVNDPDKSINGYFQVQKIAVRSKAGNMFSYAVSITKKFFDYVEFFQLLLKKASNFLINQNVQVIIPANVDETITIQDVYNLLSVSDFYRAGMIHNKFRNFENISGSASSAGPIGNISQGRFLEGTGSASIQTVTDYNKTKTARLITTGTNTARIQSNFVKIPGGIDISVWLDIKINSQSGSGNIKVFFNEYDVDQTLIQTNEIIIDKNLPDFVNYLIELTTNINTEYYRIGVSIEGQAGNISFGGARIHDNSINTVINPGIANFSFAS